MDFLPHEDELERLVLAYSPKLKHILDLAEQQIREGKGVKHEEFWREVKPDMAGAS